MPAQLVQVISCDEGRRGLGTSASLVRKVVRYYSPDGLLLAEVDEWLMSRFNELRAQALEAKRLNDITKLAAVAMTLASLDALPGDTGHAG